MRTFILGLDGLSWRVLNPYIDKGYLPTFKRLRDEGASGVLESTIPPITPPGWTSMLTGKNPGKHGLWNFVHPRRAASGYEFDLQTRFDYEARPLWRLLTAFGTRGVFYNVPFAFPPDPQVGDSILVSGFMTPGSRAAFSQPAGLADDLRGRGYAEAFEVPRDAATACRITALKFRTALDLARRYEWRIFFMVIDEPDRLQHEAWARILADDPACREYYCTLDRGVAEVMAALGPDDSLWIVSDHGFRSASQSLGINDWLREAGLLELHGGVPVAGLLRAHVVDAVRSSSAGAKMLAAIERARRDGSHKGTGDMRIVQGTDPRLDWGSTAAFGLLPGACCAVFKSRDDSATEARLGESMAHLGDAAPGLIRAFRGADLFSGPYAATLPDWLIMAEEPLTFNTTVHGKLWRRMPPDGAHERDGIVLVHGAGVPRLQGLRFGVCDVLPTVLHALELPVPNDVDGTVVPALAGNPASMLWDPTTGSTYDARAGGGTALKDRLAKL